HARAAAYWADRGDGLEETHHWIEAGDLEGAASRLIEIGPGFAESAHAGDLEAALLRVPRDPRLEELLAEAEMFLGKFTEARAVLERIVASGAPSERLRARIRLGRIANRLGSYADSRTMLGDAVQEAAALSDRTAEGEARRALGAGDVRFASIALANAVENFLRLEAVEAAATSAERALRLAQTIGDPVAVSTAQANLGLVFAKRGDWAKAEQNLLGSVELIARLDNPYSLASRYQDLAQLYEAQGRGADAAPWKARAADLFARLHAGSPTQSVP